MPETIRTERQREKDRAYRKRQRDRALAEQMRGAVRCPKGLGAGRCGGPLETRIGRLGETLVVCLWCERRERGICRDCPAPVEGTVGRAARCAVHKAEAKRAQQRASEERHHEERRVRERERYRTDDAERERRREYGRRYRRAHPEKVRAWKRREALKQKPSTRRYQTRYRQRYAAYIQEREQARWAAERRAFVAPTCRTCGKRVIWEANWKGRPPRDCDRCVWPCIAKQRRAARKRQRERVKAIEAAMAEASARAARRPVKRPPGATTVMLVDGRAAHRCVSCDAVLTGRAKQCAACKAAATARALEQLAPRRGRGRRVDLESRRVA